MSTASVEQVEQNFAAWMAAVRHGETVAIMEQGQEIARLTPSPRVFAKSTNPWATRMAELEVIFPEPVQGAFSVLEEMRSDRL